jgi:hypothetical protein
MPSPPTSSSRWSNRRPAKETKNKPIPHSQPRWVDGSMNEGGACNLPAQPFSRVRLRRALHPAQPFNRARNEQKHEQKRTGSVLVSRGENKRPVIFIFFPCPQRLHAVRSARRPAKETTKSIPLLPSGGEGPGMRGRFRQAPVHHQAQLPFCPQAHPLPGRRLAKCH